MKTTKKAERLLKEMAAIREMERGTVCKMTGRDHFNHQTWRGGKNVVRYVPQDEVAELQRAVDGYRRFKVLAERYADEIIRLSRRQREKNAKKKNKDKHRI